jgi:twitching motility protein PilT
VLKTLEPFLEAFKKTQAEEMRLEPGERLAMVMAGHKIPVGREPMQPGTLLRMASEALNPRELSALAQKAHRLETDHSGERFEVTFSRPNGAVHIVVRKSSAGVEPAPAPAETRRSPATAARPAPSAPRPAAAPAFRAPVESGEMDSILRRMVESGASDLHLSSGSCPVLRVHGEIQFLKDQEALGSEDIRKLLYSILDPETREIFEETHDADCAYEIPGVSRFRVNVFEDRRGVGSVIRTIPMSILTAADLGLSQAILDLCFLTKGLVLVTGPTGSGKSTTLAAMVDHINKNRNDHIITIEDPIEFVHENQNCLVNQRQVRKHTASFKAALRAALREDPDIVLVGELRDLETIAIAIETAETGHLVFGTLHTNTAVATVDRIIDQFPPDQQAQIRVMLADSLKGVVAQVLCKKKGGGRVAALEVLLGNMALASLIREGKTFQIPSIMQTSKKAGMTTMNDSLFSLVKQGLVEPKEAWMKSVDKSGLVGLFKSGGIPVDFASA